MFARLRAECGGSAAGVGKPRRDQVGEPGSGTEAAIHHEANQPTCREADRPTVLEATAAAKGRDEMDTPSGDEAARRRETALTVREVPTIAGPLRVLEDITGVWASGNGATIWDSALLLASVLQRQSDLAGARAVELGAGTGLVGMCLAKLGAKVTLTERALALPLLRQNIAENGLDAGPSAARVEDLSWGVQLPAWATDAPFDIVVGSDLVFPSNAECHGLLVETLAALVQPETRCWLAYEPREQACDESFLAMLARHFEVSRLSGEELERGAEDLWVLRLKTKRSAAGGATHPGRDGPQ